MFVFVFILYLLLEVTKSFLYLLSLESFGIFRASCIYSLCTLYKQRSISCIYAWKLYTCEQTSDLCYKNQFWLFIFLQSWLISVPHDPHDIRVLIWCICNVIWSGFKSIFSLSFFLTQTQFEEKKHFLLQTQFHYAKRKTIISKRQKTNGIFFQLFLFMDDYQLFSEIYVQTWQMKNTILGIIVDNGFT